MQILRTAGHSFILSHTADVNARMSAPQERRSIMRGVVRLVITTYMDRYDRYSSANLHK